MSTIEVGDLLYEYTVKFTEVTEYGVSLEALMAGEAAPPVEGARFDVAFEGESTGPRLKGNVKGVDHPILIHDPSSIDHEQCFLSIIDAV